MAPTKQFSNPLVFEELEPRLLFSADVAEVLAVEVVEQEFVEEPFVIADLETESQENDVAAQPAEEGVETSDQTIENEKTTADETPLDESAVVVPEAVVITGNESTSLASELRTELVLVNENVSEYEQLVENINKGSNTNRSIEVVILSSDESGIAQVNQILSERGDLDAIHIISHGFNGGFSLGSDWLDSDDLIGSADSISSWSSALSDDADILLYGCNIAADDVGQSVITTLAELTGADVAASDDLTGDSSLGGDWELEYQLGNIETEVSVTQAGQENWNHLLDIDSGLVAHYTFDEGSGTAALDSSVNDNDGKLIGSPVYATGVVGTGALDFSGDFDYVEVPDSAVTDFGSGDFTVGFWLNSTDTGLDRLVGDLAAGSSGYLFYSPGSGDVSFDVFSGFQSVTLGTTGVLDGEWHQVTGTRSGDDFSLYVDGTLVDSVSNPAMGSIDNSAPLRIGATDSSSNDYDGLIDDVRLYNRALTSTDIVELSNSHNVLGTDVAATDLSSGIEINTDGGNDAYLVADDGGALLGGLTAFTLETTFAIGDHDNEPGLISYYVGADEIRLRFDTTDHLRFKINNINVTTSDTYSELLDGNLHHIAVSWDSSNGDVMFYVDGEFSEHISGLEAGYTIAGGGVLAIGNDQDGVDTGYKTGQTLYGTLHDVRIWDEVRSAEEIALNYQHKFDTSSLPSGLIANWQMDGFDVSVQVVDVVSSNNLSIAHATGTDFVTSTPVAGLNVDENVVDGTTVGFVVPTDPDITNDIVSDGLFLGGDTGVWTSFDSGSTMGGWIVGGGGVDHTSKWETSLGGVGIDLERGVDEAGGTISQVLTTEVGKVYQILFSAKGNFDAAGEADGSLLDKGLRVTASSTSQDFTITDTGVYEPLSVTFVATGTSTTLTFEGLGTTGYGAVVSDVRGIEVSPAIATILANDSTLTYDAATGKFYRNVQDYISWDAAQDAAIAADLNGVSGQLATIGSAYENNLLRDLSTTSFGTWLGGSDKSVEGEFHWYNGSTSDELFWQGDGTTGSAQNGNYTNFAASQPDNNGDADFVYLNRTTGEWDDADSAPDTINTYIIEWDASEVLSSYTFSLTDNADGRFAINSSTGEITVADDSRLDYETNPSHAINVQVTDAAGNVYSEVMTVQVNDLGGEPTQTLPAAQSVEEDGSLVFSGANAITVSDTSAEDLPLQVVLSVDNGTLTLSPTTDLSIILAGANSSSLMTIQGTESVINAALDGLTYTPTGNYNGSSTLQMTSSLGAGLVGHYTFEAGDATDDSVGVSQENGTLTNPVYITNPNTESFTTDDERGEVLLLQNDVSDSDREYVTINSVFNEPADVTLAAWVNYTSSDIDTNGGDVISIGNDIALRVADGTEGVSGFFWDGTAHQFIGTGTGTSLGDGEWHHLAFSFDDVANTQKLYIDGELAASASLTTSITYTGWFPQTSIGAHADRNPANTENLLFDFNGMIDDARVYNRALSAEEIASLATDTTSVTGSVDITVNPVNDAPEMDDGGFLTLSDITEDETTNSGNLISEILTSDFANVPDVITDIDLGAVEGIAIYATSGNGTWEYNIDGSWEVVGSVSDANSLLLRDSDRLRYVPDGISGDTGFVSFVAWDQTSGTVGAYTDRTVGTSFSSKVEIAVISVSNVNDAPIVDLNGSDGSGNDFTVSFTEGGGPVSVVDIDAVVSDVDSSLFQNLNVNLNGAAFSANDQVSIGGHAFTFGTIETAIRTVGSSVFKLAFEDGSGFNISLNSGGMMPQADLQTLLRSITYENISETPTTGDRTIEFSAQDSLGLTGLVATSTISITAVNDAPSFEIPGQSVFTAGNTGYGQNEDMHVLSDGSMLLLPYDNSGDSVLVKLSVDGTIDTSFGTNGYADNSSIGYIQAVTEQSDGKILISGFDTGGLFVARYDADGTIDTSFGSAGVATIATATFDEANDIAVQSDGKVVIVGEYGDDSLIARFTADGALDSGFGTGGIVTVNLSGTFENLESIAIQNDGKIVAAGEGSIVRLDDTGSFDATFDTDGILAVGHNVYGVTLQSDGKVLATGDNGTSLVVSRFNTDGSVDTTFGSGGSATWSHPSNSSGMAIVQQSDSKLVIAGNITDYPTEWIVLRFNTDGTLDTTFGDSGAWIMKDSSDFSEAFSVSLYNDGATERIVVGGYTTNFVNSSIATIVRLDENGTLDATVGTNTLDDQPTFIEDGAVVILDTDVEIFDAELSGIDNFDGATLTLARSISANSDDVFTATGLLGTLTESGNLIYDGVTVGTVTTNSGGSLVLTFNASSTNLIVNSVMQATAYSNSNDAPPASVQIDWTFNDSNNSAQGSGGSLTATGSTTVTITAVNDDPTITSTAVTTVDEDSAYSYSFTVSDADAGDTLTLSAPILPSWLSFDSASGILSGTPTNGEVGSHSVTLRVNDGTSDVDQTFTIVVSNTNDIPTITSTAVTTVDEDSAYSYTFTVSDDDAGDTITLSAPTLPSWLTFNTTTGILSGTPSNGEVGIHSVTLRVNDGTSVVDQTFTIVVSNTNDTPTITSTAVTTVDEDSAYSYTFTVSDDDAGDTLTLSAPTLPTWLSFDSASGVLSGTPTNGEVGSHSVTLRVNDKTSDVDQTFTIVVSNTNDTPTITSSAMTTVDEDSAYSYTFTVSDDDAGDTLTLSAPTLPTWLSFDSASGILSGIPTNGEVGSHSVTLRVNDGTSDVDQTFTIVVSNTNDTPTITSTAVTTVDEDSAYSYTFTVVDDDAGDTLTLSAPTLPTWLSFDSASGILSGTPTNGEVGSHSVTLRVNDGTSDVDQTFTIAVSNTNDTPTITSTAVTTVDEDSAYSYTFTVSDDDAGDTLTLSAPTLPTWLSFDSDTGILSGTPTNAEVGNHSVTLRVNDGTSDVDQIFTIVVSNTNDIPIITSTAVTAATEDSAYSYTFTVSDEDAGDTLSLSAPTLPTWLSFDTDTGILSGTPTNAEVGNHSVTLRVNDGTSDVDQIFTIVVSNTNDIPIITSTAVTAATEDSAYSYTFTVSDEDAGDTLSLSAPTLPTWLSFDSGTGILSGTPINAEVGNHSVTLRVNDGTSDVDQIFTIVVSNTNNVPIITSTAVTTVDEDSAYSYTFTVSDTDAGDTLSLSAPTLPTWLSFDSGTGILSGTPTNAEVGSHSVTLRVNDGTSDVDQTFTIVVSNTNDIPTITSSAVTTVDEDSAYSYTFTVIDDDAGDTLTLSAPILPSWLSFDSGTGILSGTPINAEVGNHSVTLRVNDGTSDVDQIFTIVVSNTNNVPIITSTAVTTVDEDSAYSYTFTVSDTDAGDTLSLSAPTLPTWLSFDSGTGILSGTPTNAEVGSHSVTLRVNDGTSDVDQTFTIVVSNTNDIPTITSSAVTTVDEDSAYSYTFTVIDDDAGDILTLSAPILPSWLTFNSTTGVLSGTPTNGEVGSHSVTLRVNDGTSDVDQTFTIVVSNTNDTPTITSTAVTTVDEDSAYSYTFTVSDADAGDTLTLSAPILPSWLTFNSTTGVLSGTPTNAEVGSHNVTLRVNDGTDDVDQVFTIVVSNTNDAPTITSTAVTTVDEDSAYSYTFTVSDADAGDTLTLSAPTLPSWLTFNSTTGVLSGTPTNGEVGSHNVTLRVNDGTVDVDQTFTIVVSNTNDAPVIAGSDTANLYEDVDPDQDGALEISGVLTINDPDANESSFVAETIDGLYGSLALDTLGNWSYVADNSQIAIQQLGIGESLIDTVAVTSIDGTLHTFTVTINGVNEPVVIDNTGGLGGGNNNEQNDGPTDEPIDDGNISSPIDVVTEDDIVPDFGSEEDNTPQVDIESDAVVVPVDNDQQSPSEDDEQDRTIGDPDVVETVTVSVVNPESEIVLTADSNILDNSVVTDDNAHGEARVNGRLQPIQKSHLMQMFTKGLKIAEEGVFDFIAAPLAANPVYLEMGGVDLHIPVSENKSMQSQVALMQDEIEQAYEESKGSNKVIVYVTSGVSASLTAGVATYMLRAGSLMTSFLATVPIWKGFDPVAILTMPKKKKDKKGKSRLNGPDSEVPTDQNAENMFDVRDK
ncbi:MAG: putative delta-60 repeat protein [Desulforhopalus sp.]|jgi:uncharacterized delta-60 repeat protein